MTEEKQNRTAIIAVVTGVIALLLGLCIGAVVGGAGGYMIGRSATSRAIPTSQAPRSAPAPALPQLPRGFGPGGLPQAGAIIQEVIQGTPAAAAGLEQNDVITRVDNAPVDANHELAAMLAQYKPGDQVTLTVWRAGNTQTIQVTLGASPDDASRAYLGIRYVELAPPQATPQP